MVDVQRFPIEPSSQDYEPTEYNLNSGGKPKYNVMPYIENQEAPQDVNQGDSEDNSMQDDIVDGLEQNKPSEQLIQDNTSSIEDN